MGSSTNLLLLLAAVASRAFYVVNGQCDASSRPTVLSGSGEFTSPTYPTGYPDNSNCQWKITSSYPAASGLVRINITDLCTETTYDYIRFYDGGSTSASVLGTVSGCDPMSLLTSPVFMSSQSVMLVEFISDGSNSNDGFSIVYSSLELPTTGACSASGRPLVLRDSSGAITSPFYPDNYLPNANCQWRINADSGSVITFDITYFCTEVGFDFLRIYDGIDNHGALIRTVSGCVQNGIQHIVVRSTQPSMFIVFMSDLSVVHPGFTATYTASGGLFPACTESRRPLLLGANNGDLASPNYPRPYFHNADCQWKLIARPNEIIRMWMVDFCTELTNDYLLIYDGDNSRSQALGQVSGCPLTSALTTSGDFASSQRYMFLRFITDSQIANRGFNATYSSAPASLGPACSNQSFPLIMSGRSGAFSSPYYPSNYPNNLDCRWLIRGGSTRMIVNVVINRICLEPRYDFLRLYDGEDFTKRQLSEQTGTFNVTQTFTSSQRDLFVRLTTDESNVCYGFTATYTILRT